MSGRDFIQRARRAFNTLPVYDQGFVVALLMFALAAALLLAATCLEQAA